MSPPRVRTLILAHLGLTLGCKRAETVTPDAATATATATASATATATATETASADAAPSASTKSIPTIALTFTASLPPGRCRSNSDCAGMPGATCVGITTTDLGYCRGVIRRGRPLVVAGESHVAAIGSTVESHLVDAARDEHASIAAFARTICVLMSMGAPTWLVGETADALADEVRHTNMTLDAIERITGERPVLGDLALAASPLEHDIGEFFRDVFRGGAIGETLAAAYAERELRETTDPEMRAFYDTIVVDEARHAALAFKTLRWLLVKDPTLERVRDEEIARFENAPPHERTLVVPLFELLV